MSRGAYHGLEVQSMLNAIDHPSFPVDLHTEAVVNHLDQLVVVPAATNRNAVENRTTAAPVHQRPPWDNRFETLMTRS